MSYEKEIEAIQSEWEPEDGFFWRIRQGQFESNDFARVLNKVASITIAENAVVPRRIVSLLWYIPMFMQWQLERVRENNGDVAAYDSASAQMTNEIERLLGVP